MEVTERSRRGAGGKRGRKGQREIVGSRKRKSEVRMDGDTEEDKGDKDGNLGRDK